MKRLFLIIAVFYATVCFSQKFPFSPTYRSTMAGIGATSVYDSYLSPLKYSGVSFFLTSEQMNLTRFADGKIIAQQLLSLEFAKTYNPAQTAFAYSGLLQYDFGMFYRFFPARNFSVFAGTQADALLGFIYNSRNSNNPATGKAHLNLNLSAMASYSFRINKIPVRLSDQVSLPFVGAMYSPEFGQSYYEMYDGEWKHLIHLSSFHNFLFFKNFLSAEISVAKTTFRVGYLHSFYQTRINSLDAQMISNAFFIGISKNFFVAPFLLFP
jgi:hypothetical protein